MSTKKYEVLLRAVMLEDKKTVAREGEIIDLDPESKWTQMLLAKGAIESPNEETAADKAPPVTQAKVRKLYRGHEILSEIEKKIAGVIHKHVRLGNGTEMDLSPYDYEHEVRTTHL